MPGSKGGNTENCRKLLNNALQSVSRIHFRSSSMLDRNPTRERETPIERRIVASLDAVGF